MGDVIMSELSEKVERPVPIVKTPVLRRFGKIPPRPFKVGRGFSIGEIESVGLDVKTARLLGVYVDRRRKTVYERNIATLKEWLNKIKEEKIKPTPTIPKYIIVKRDLRKVFKGKTMAGRKSRGLLKLKLRHTHHYKWKRKQRERLLKKRHEAIRHKGGD